MRRLLLLPLSLVAALLAALPVSAASAAPPPRGASGWSDLPTGSTARFRGLSAVDSRTAWVSGTGGTVLRTTDGGRSWQDVSPGGDTTSLQFRDVEAFDARTAVVLGLGDGSDFRIFRTTDGGRTWQRTFANAEPTAFYDCMSFWDRQHGLALSDPVDGHFRVLRTSDGGASWSVVDPAGMPAALPGEAAFAASGTCIVTSGRSDAWIASGGGSSARVFHSANGGSTWSVTSTPVASSPAGGIFSLAVRPDRPRSADLVAVGGDYTAPEVGTRAAATSTDAGRTWRASGPLGGYRSGAAFVRQGGNGRGSDVVIAVGPTGSDVSTDAGRTWRTFDTTSLDSVQCTRDHACWASGDLGRVARLVD